MVQGAVYLEALTFAELERKARAIFGAKLDEVIFTRMPSRPEGVFKAEARKIPGELSDGA
jgi:hypothetical protein